MRDRNPWNTQFECELIKLELADMSFIIALVCFSYAGISIFRYMKSTFSLLGEVQSLEPEVWERRGGPHSLDS